MFIVETRLYVYFFLGKKKKSQGEKDQSLDLSGLGGENMPKVTHRIVPLCLRGAGGFGENTRPPHERQILLLLVYQASALH